MVTGAGWGADSGLATYNDIGDVPAYVCRGLEYSDVSRPQWIEDEPELFYGFWGQAFNDYRKTKPHAGFNIVARWRNDKNHVGDVADTVREEIALQISRKVPTASMLARNRTSEIAPYQVGATAGAFFCFTSNVDGHWYDVLQAHEIHDCHGNIELWQCSDRDCEGGLWRAPLEFEFWVNKDTMLAPAVRERKLVDYSKDGSDEKISKARIGRTVGKERRNPSTLLQHMPKGTDGKGWYMDSSSPNWPRCGHCEDHKLARPGIFMFGDFGWKYDELQYERWERWRSVVCKLAKKNGYKVCIVEVGCGTNVATCRNTSEELLEDMGLTSTLVRINPDEPGTTDPNPELQKRLISIRSKGLEAIERIDTIYRNEYRTEANLDS